MSSVVLFLALALQSFPISTGQYYTISQISKIFEAAVLRYPKDEEMKIDTLKCAQVVSQEGGANVTKYYLVENAEDEPDISGVPAFTRKRNDTGKPWLYISKTQDHLYTWETQTMVVLKQSTQHPKVYIALMIYFRQVGPESFTVEWDKWKPRGPLPINECPCSPVEKFFRPCENWEYCKLVSNVYDQSAEAMAGNNDTSSRRRRDTYDIFNGNRFKRQDQPPMEDNDSEMTDMGNEVPRGSVPTFGPFFWDIVDTPEEAGETNERVKKHVLNQTQPKYYEDVDNVPFSGYGDCPYEVKDGEFDQLMEEKDSKKLMEFYVKSMRAQCDDDIKDDIKGIVNSKLVKWNATLGFFVFNRKHTFRTSQGLTDNELDQLEIAMHFAAYTYLYPKIAKQMKEEKEQKVGRDAVTPTGKRIHRNTRMVVLMTIRLYDMIRNDVGTHEVKLIRRLVINLKSHLMLGLHSRTAYAAKVERNSSMCTGEGKSSSCTKLREVFKKDAFQAVVLTYFILFGDDPFAPPEVRGLPSYVKYVNFYQFRIRFLEHYFKNYW